MIGNKRVCLLLIERFLELSVEADIDSYSVAVKGERIADTGKDTQRTIGPETAFALGFQGIIEFLELCKDQPAKVFSVVPSMASISPGIRAYDDNKDIRGKWGPYGKEETYQGRSFRAFEEAQ